MECKFVLSEYQKEELKFVFELFSPKDGKISIESAKQLLLKLENESEKSQHIDRENAKYARSEPNSPDNFFIRGVTPFVNISSISNFPGGVPEISFEEFTELYQNILSQDSFEDVLKHAFSIFDVRKSGLINAKDLQKVADIFGETIQNEEEARRLISVIHSGETTAISYEEFKEFFINNIKNDENST